MNHDVKYIMQELFIFVIHEPTLLACLSEMLFYDQVSGIAGHWPNALFQKYCSAWSKLKLRLRTKGEHLTHSQPPPPKTFRRVLDIAGGQNLVGRLHIGH